MLPPEKIADKIKAEIIRKISESPRRLTPATVLSEMAASFQLKKRVVSKAIRDLVQEKALVYTYTFGCTFLEPSFEKPVHIANRVVLKPPNLTYKQAAGEVVVSIAAGVSFGTGTHPTTRLAIEGGIRAFDDIAMKDRADIDALDIGTGSGVLAIAAVGMGAQGAVGIDIDACARVEAENNIKLNGLEKKIRILSSLEEYQGPAVTLVTANLRFPTLASLTSFFSIKMERPGFLVVSGIKQDEVVALKTVYETIGLACCWEKVEHDWAGLLFKS